MRLFRNMHPVLKGDLIYLAKTYTAIALGTGFIVLILELFKHHVI